MRKKKDRPRPPDPEPESEVLDFSETRLRLTAFEGLVRARFKATLKEAAAKKEIRDLNGKIEALMIQSGVEKVMVGRLEAARIESSSSTISKQKLLDVGVPMKKIEQATTKTPYSYVRIEDVDERKARKEQEATQRKAS